MKIDTFIERVILLPKLSTEEKICEVTALTAENERT